MLATEYLWISLLVSESLLAVYYQHTCQCFALTFEITAQPHVKHAFPIQY